MMVLNYGCKDFFPIGLPQSGDVGFEIVEGNPMSPTMPPRTSPKYVQYAVTGLALADVSPSGS
jgi:hypothetical protein